MRILFKALDRSTHGQSNCPILEHELEFPNLAEEKNPKKNIKHQWDPCEDFAL